MCLYITNYNNNNDNNNNVDNDINYIDSDINAKYEEIMKKECRTN